MGQSPKPLDGISVLVVDDNQDALDLLEAMLTYYGALTITADDGRDALARLASTRVDVIISDISMPGLSGYDFIRAVRALPSDAARPVPAIALTAFQGREGRVEALRAGFHTYLLKPFNAAELVREIVKLVERAR
jgi:CheY-like chemotaxis protein